MQYTVIQKIHTYTKNESKHSKMGPVRQNPIRKTVTGKGCPRTNPAHQHVWEDYSKSMNRQLKTGCTVAMCPLKLVTH